MKDSEKINFSMNDNLWVMIKGLIIGGTMLVPGVSGGSMAMILGIYDELIGSVSSFMKHKSASFKFLLLFASGGSLGMFLFSRPVLYMIEEFTMPTLFFFMGTVVGGAPYIFKKSRLEGFSWRGMFFAAIGVAIVLLVSVIPAGESDRAVSADMQSALFLMLAGLAAAVALVLPGISISYLLLIMGLYDETMNAISQVYMPFLLPLSAGLLLGIILTTKLLEKAMSMFPQPTYLIILGFVLGSLKEVFPGIPKGMDIIFCIAAFAAGASAVFFLSRKGEEKKPEA